MARTGQIVRWSSFTGSQTVASACSATSACVIRAQHRSCSGHQWPPAAVRGPQGGVHVESTPRPVASPQAGAQEGRDGAGAGITPAIVHRRGRGIGAGRPRGSDHSGPSGATGHWHRWARRTRRGHPVRWSCGRPLHGGTAARAGRRRASWSDGAAPSGPETGMAVRFLRAVAGRERGARADRRAVAELDREDGEGGGPTRARPAPGKRPARHRSRPQPARSHRAVPARSRSPWRGAAWGAASGPARSA